MKPTTGVDAVSRKEFWQMLKKPSIERHHYFVSTPYMTEAGLCDRVALIQKGKKLCSIDSPHNIISQLVNNYGQSGVKIFMP